GQFAVDVTPVADGGILGTGAADEMNVGGQGCGLAGAEPVTHLGRKRPGAGDGPAPADEAREECLPALGGLMGKDDAADAILLEGATDFGERYGHSRFVPLGGLL